MKQTFEELFLTIVQDGGTVTVGDKTFNVTLADAAKVTEPEPELFVRESVEFVKFNGLVNGLKKDGYALFYEAPVERFALTQTRFMTITHLRPKLIPCLETDVKVGGWMVDRKFTTNTENYLLKTKDGFVGFTDDDYQPFRFSNVEEPESEVYKVVFP
jgi:hypothetical protein